MQYRHLLEKPLAAIVLSALSFYLLFRVNGWLFEWLDYSYGVSWVFLPSGLRLALVLIFGGYGALGVVLGTLWAGLDQGKPWLDAALSGLVSGLAPWAALWISRRWLGLQADLSNLGLRLLIQIALVFALISAMSHQLLYLSMGRSEDFLGATSVMAIGDLAGTLIVLYAIKLLSGRRGPPLGP